MSDNPINPSIVLLIPHSLRKLTKQIAAGEAVDHRAIMEVRDACQDLYLTVDDHIRDDAPDSVEAYENASKGGP